MAARELLVVILNHTNEELNLEPGFPSLEHGQIMDTPDSQPPQEILAGESGLLRCKSHRVGMGVEGSVRYRIIGFEGRNTVTFVWNVHYLGQNKFDAACAVDSFKVRVLGGQGSQAVVVFVFEPANL
ncbi:hypothetical protein BGZ63DRAFT_458668 [Mariannaea sp. PMI_226]|nr:hypothetical protein BGZ63DRAFT_458668 [Mariannaea sp. PMI_226]